MRPWMDYQQQKCVMQFLKGLKSYAQTCTQILMMDFLSPITKDFAFVVQEEWKQAINLGITFSSHHLEGNASTSPSTIASIVNFTPKPKRGRLFILTVVY